MGKRHPGIVLTHLIETLFELGKGIILVIVVTKLRNRSPNVSGPKGCSERCSEPDRPLTHELLESFELSISVFRSELLSLPDWSTIRSSPPKMSEKSSSCSSSAYR